MHSQGDAVRVIFDSEVVSAWTNSREHIFPPYEETEFFEKVPYCIGKRDIMHVSDIRQELENAGEDADVDTAMQRFMCVA